jgi:hypothetical protein
MSANLEQAILKKLQALPDGKQQEVLDFVESLTHRHAIVDQTTLHQALAEYASEHAGSAADLDTDLEAASIEQLLQEGA